MRRSVPLLIMLTASVAMLAGCHLVQPESIWVHKNDSFLNNVVDAELWPKYQTHPDVTPAGMANVGAAIAEHRAFLDEIESAGTVGTGGDQ